MSKKKYEVLISFEARMDGRTEPIVLNPGNTMMVYEPLTDPAVFDLGIAFVCTVPLETLLKAARPTM
jgi:hypothetical protein